MPLGITDKYNGVKDSAMTASSQYSRDTAPHYARLFYSDGFLWDYTIGGAGAWIAGKQDSNQYIQIDLGSRHVIQEIATQGRQGSRQFVTDYYFYYSDSENINSIFWLVYRDDYGEPFLFDANVNDNDVHINTLKYPIIARFVRIMPQRWNNVIALRMELFGCKYLPSMAYFNGENRIEFNLSDPNLAVQTYQDNIRFRFRTSFPNGLILYGDDGQGDYLSIQLFRSRLRLEISLGSTMDRREIVDNVIESGSVLDDNQWHDVEIYREGKIINITVDKVEMWRNLSAAFVILNMNRQINLGGLSNYLGRNGLSISNGFIGCLEEVWFNGMNMIRDALRQYNTQDDNTTESWWVAMGYPAPNKQQWLGRQMTERELNITGFTIYGQLDTKCPDSIYEGNILSFSKRENYLAITRILDNELRIWLDFRTFDMAGTLIYHETGLHTNFIWIYIMSDGRIGVKVEWNQAMRPINHSISNPDVFAEERQFADGTWHSMDLHVRNNEVKIVIDNHVTSTVTKFFSDIAFSRTTYIGGGRPHEESFIGCIRNLRIHLKDVESNEIGTSVYTSGIIKGRCTIIDRCNPNPCKHQAPCTQRADVFICDCSLTGYVGAVCHQSILPSSCEEARLIYNKYTPTLTIMIDMDGSGVLPPMNVTCDFTDKTNVWTILHHNVVGKKKVDGYASPGSYVMKLDYFGAPLLTIRELTRRAAYCEQAVYYQCNGAQLLGDGGGAISLFRSAAYGWWVGIMNQPRYYWGGSVPGLQACACGISATCASGTRTCNCDGLDAPPGVEDQGLLQFKNDLPVMEIHLGDTGVRGDNKYSIYEIGPLRCQGDSLFDNTVTFRKADTNIQLPPIYSETEFDVSFIFKTTIFDAVFMQNYDSQTGHIFEVRLRHGNSVQLKINVGNGVTVVESTVANNLNDNNWHIVRLERNRLNSRLKIDEQKWAVYDEPTDRAFQPLRFNENLFIGSTQALTDGFLGCLTNLIMNGVVQDIRGMVERGEFTYGLSPGCVPKCEPNPCLNRGECYEYYSHYYCECGLTPYRGYICGRQMAASLRDSIMLTMSFNNSQDHLGFINEFITVGFKTKEKTGILMQMSSQDRKEYIIVKMNKNGGISIEFDVGFEWQEIATDAMIDLANNQHHTVTAWRTDLGKTWHIKVDDYEERVVSYTMSIDTDTRLDNPKFMFVGRNDTMKPTTTFKGCIYAAQWNNIFPLRMFFSEPPIPGVTHEPIDLDVVEGKCGIEEIMPKPDPIEIREYPTIPSNLNLEIDQLEPESSAWIIIVVVLPIGFVLIIILLCCFFRNFTLRRGNYETQEARGTKGLLSADLALKYGESGQPNVGYSEWFM